MITIATTGGGTAGHVIPCVALFPDLKKRFDRIIHIGGNGMEKQLIPSYGIDFYETNVIKFDRTRLLSNLKIPFVLSAATREAKTILMREKVNVVFGKGGYASLPTILGAKKLGIPIVIHESDYNMGLANKLVSKYAHLILTSFPETKGGLYVGNPLRKEIFMGDKRKLFSKYCLDRNKKTILVFGGSSGARIINDVIFSLAKDLITEYNLIHLVGNNEKRRLFAQNYIALPYVNNMQDFFAIADIIIMRGGANSLQEVTSLGKRVICIPLPKSKSSRGDQIDNANSYYKRGLIDVLYQEDLTSQKLMQKINSIIQQKERPVCKDTPNQDIVKKIWDVFTLCQS